MAAADSENCRDDASRQFVESAVVGATHWALTVRCTIGDLRLILSPVLILVLDLVARAVTVTGAVVELVLCPLLDALLFLHTWHRLVGGAVTIPVPIRVGIDARGNRRCWFWSVGLGQRHARGYGE